MKTIDNSFDPEAVSGLAVRAAEDDIYAGCERSPDGKHYHGEPGLPRFSQWYWCGYCGNDLTPDIRCADAPGRDW